MAQRKPRKPRSAATSGARDTSVFDRIVDLAMNLHWTWSPEAQRLFAAVDPALWRSTNHNPIRILEALRSERREALECDETIRAQLEVCERELKQYLKTRPWFERTARGRDRRLKVAYFCSEYALHESLPQYAGGLGVLAGDHLKSASDLGVPLVGIGRLYRNGYYEQQLRADGTTRVVYPHYDFREWPLEDTGQTVAVPIARRIVYARIWKQQVGRTELYLLDADISRNKPRDRRLTQRLYGGDSESRLQQQILLGIGGVRALRALGIQPTVFHLNEGHAAFAGLERLRKLRMSGKSFDKALEIVRGSSVFTTHTPVPAGHDRYPWKMVVKYLAPIGEALGITWEEFLALGREHPDDRREPFCMTVLALKLSAHVNGVSKLHGEVTREMWKGVYGARRTRDVPIGHVTNGVHPQTWLAPEMDVLYRRYLRPRWLGIGPDTNWSQRADRIPPEEFWAMRNKLRARLINFIRQKLLEQIHRRLGPTEDNLLIHDAFDKHALTIGFARRFATYKRAPLIFHDPRRLARILNDGARPVQLVFAGKAHPDDQGGQAYVQRIFRYTRSRAFAGKVAFIENYDMRIGRLLTSGCDLWLNNPLRPMEASGTSGMKPPLHGGLNCSILDGWWAEGYNKRNGWAVGDGRTFKSRAAQDRYDAGALYDLLENRIVPLFYERNRRGVPAKWVRMMVASLQSVGQPFSSHRMVGEYVRDYYLPAHR